MSDIGQLIDRNLLDILGEMKAQTDVGATYPADRLQFEPEMAQIQEFIKVGEAGLAYECIVANLESVPFRLSGSSTVKLLEVGLLMGFKTDRPEDLKFDRRRPTA